MKKRRREKKPRFAWYRRLKNELLAVCLSERHRVRGSDLAGFRIVRILRVWIDRELKQVVREVVRLYGGQPSDKLPAHVREWNGHKQTLTRETFAAAGSQGVLVGKEYVQIDEYLLRVAKKKPKQEGDDNVAKKPKAPEAAVAGRKPRTAPPPPTKEPRTPRTPPPIAPHPDNMPDREDEINDEAPTRFEPDDDNWYLVDAKGKKYTKATYPNFAAAEEARLAATDPCFVRSDDCEHTITEDHLICQKCGRCREDVDNDDICIACGGKDESTEPAYVPPTTPREKLTEVREAIAEMIRNGLATERRGTFASLKKREKELVAKLEVEESDDPGEVTIGSAPVAFEEDPPRLMPADECNEDCPPPVEPYATGVKLDAKLMAGLSSLLARKPSLMIQNGALPTEPEWRVICPKRDRLIFTGYGTKTESQSAVKATIARLSGYRAPAKPPAMTSPTLELSKHVKDVTAAIQALLAAHKQTPDDAPAAQTTKGRPQPKKGGKKAAASPPPKPPAEAAELPPLDLDDDDENPFGNLD